MGEQAKHLEFPKWSTTKESQLGNLHLLPILTKFLAQVRQVEVSYKVSN